MKAILVIDIPNDLSLSDLSLYGGLWETGEEDGWAYEFQAEDIKPLPQKKEVEVNEIEDIMHTEFSIEDIYTNKYIATIRLATDKLISLGWNDCLEEIMK